MSVSYGSYSFPEPSPFVSIEDSVVYYKGTADHSAKKISIIGNLTGNSLLNLSNSKRDLTNALCSGYLILDINGEQFEYVKPLGVDFDDGGQTTILPYSVEFEYFSYTGDSNIYGVKDPTNNWSYSEQQGRIVKATHSMSAVGLKVDSSSSLDQAITFVNSIDNGFENLSAFFSGDSAYSLVKTEEVDASKGSYGRTCEYSFSTSQNPLSNKGIVTATVQIAYTKEGGLEGTVNGNIIGDMGGPYLSTGDFPPSKATQLFRNASISSRSSFENSVYGEVINGPSSLSYDVNSGANTLGFSFTFADPDEEGKTNVVHKSKVSISANKDSNIVNVGVNGNIIFQSALDILNPNNFDTGFRMETVEAYFATLNPFAMAVSGYSDFIDNVETVYEENVYLNPEPESKSITKDPFTASIDYSYTYLNVEDLSGGDLTDFNFSLTDELQIGISGVQESVSAFSVQPNINRKLGSISIQGTSNDTPDKLPTLKALVQEIVQSKNCAILDSSFTTGQASISYSLNTQYST